MMNHMSGNILFDTDIFPYQQTHILHQYSMKGIHIQFQGIINFINNSLTNRTNQSLDCYLLNLEKMTLETFTILHITLSNASHEVPKEIMSLFEKTTSKFKEYFKSKPKPESQKNDTYYQDYDEVRQFLDNRPEIKINNDSERGELYKFLSQNEEKEKNNQILLDNIPKYAYLSPNLPLPVSRKHPKRQVQTKEKAQQTYPSDFVVKLECIYPSLNSSLEEKEVQTQSSLETIKSMIEVYTKQLLEEQNQGEINKKISELFVCFNNSASEAINKNLQKKHGADLQTISDAQKMKFLEEILQSNDLLSENNNNEVFRLFEAIKGKEMKRKIKNNKNFAKRGSQMTTKPLVGQRSLNTSTKDILQKVDENGIKSLGGSGKALGFEKKQKFGGRSSIVKALQKNDNRKSGKLPQFNDTSFKKIGSQARLALNKEKENQQTARKSKFSQHEEKKLTQNLMSQLSKRDRKDNISITSKSNEKRGASSKREKKNSTSKSKREQELPNNDGNSVISKDHSSSRSKRVRDTIREEEEFKYQEQKTLKNKHNEEVQEQIQQSSEFRKSDLLDIADQKRKEDIWTNEGSKDQLVNPLEVGYEESNRNKIQLLPLLEKSKHTSLPNYDSNQQLHSRSELLAEDKTLIKNNQDKGKLEVLRQKFKLANSNSQQSLYFNQTQKLSQKLFSPKNANYSMYKAPQSFNQQRFPTVKKEQRSESSEFSKDWSLSQKQQYVKQENDRILNEIKENCSSKRNKNVEWVKLVKNIKQYQKLHIRHCGLNCIHLAKFYQFLKKHNLSMYTNRKELSLHKKNIEMNASLQ